MKTIPNNLQKIGVAYTGSRLEHREGRSFLGVVTLLLAIVSLLVILDSPTRLSPLQLILFIGLLLVHIGLHSLSPLLVENNRALAVYFLVQAALALALIAISSAPGLTLALFATLIGATLGNCGITRLSVAAVILYLILTLVGFYITGGIETVQAWLQPAISTMTVLILFMIFYRRQLEARERSQALLAELEKANSQLAAYAGQVEELTLAAERQRLARELHDTLAQGVAGFILQLEAANAHLDSGRTERARDIIQQAMRRARSTLAEARAAIDDLRLEDERSLAAGLRRQANRFSRTTGIPCHLSLDLPPAAMVSPAVAEHIERLVGESLSNISRHAQAENVWLTTAQKGAGLLLEIRDDGIGFDLSTAVSDGHYGLIGMEERVRLCQGNLHIDSQPGEGTRVEISLPLETLTNEDTL